MKKYFWLFLLFALISTATADQFPAYDEDVAPSTDDLILTLDMSSLETKKVQLGNLPSSAAGGWTDGGTNIYATTTTDNVGIGTITSLNKLTVLNGNVGIGTLVTNSLLTVNSREYSITTDALVYPVIDATTGISSTADLASAAVRTIQSSPYWTGANAVGTFAALWGISTNNGTHSTYMTNLFATVGRAQNRGTGNVTNIAGLYGDFQQKGGIATESSALWLAGGNVVIGGTATNVYGAKIDISHDSANAYITNNYGIKLGDYNANNYGDNNNIGLLIGTAPAGPVNAEIYVAPTSGNSIFMGNVGVGSANPSAKISVIGTGTSTGQTISVRNSSGTSLGMILDNGNVGLGTATPEGKFIVRTSSDIGWASKSGANTACNTTCVSGCVAGWDSGSPLPLLCTDATADGCLCSGSD